MEESPSSIGTFTYIYLVKVRGKVGLQFTRYRITKGNQYSL